MLKPEKRKEYDRNRQRELYLIYKQERKDILDFFGNKCAACQNDNSQLHLHHKEYGPESNYPRTANGWSRVKRLKEAKLFPERFVLLCPACHTLCTKIQNAPQDFLKICGFIKPTL